MEYTSLENIIEHGNVLYSGTIVSRFAISVSFDSVNSETYIVQAPIS
jgi:hypothetical protein